MTASNLVQQTKLTKRKLLALYFSSDSNSLTQELRHCFASPFGPNTVKSNPKHKSINQQDEEHKLWHACSYIVPHGAYCDAGPITAHAYHHLRSNLQFFYNQHSKLPSTVLIIGTNHRHLGPRISTSSQVWSTPFGNIEPNLEIVDALTTKCHIPCDHNAHSREHSIENQLPFIQYVYSQLQISSKGNHGNAFKIVPILVSYCQSIEEAKQYSMAIIKCIQALKLHISKDFIVVGTTDFTHAGPGYSELPPQDSNLDLITYTRVQDQQVIDQIIGNCNEQNDTKWMSMILKAQRQCNNSMCGLWSLIVTILCSRYAGLKNIKLLKYAVSAEVMFRTDVTGFGSFVMQ